MRVTTVLCLLCACGSPHVPSEPDAMESEPDAEVATCGDGVVQGAELCDGAPVACSSLTPVWSGGQAACRRDCSGYDVSSCVASTQRVDTVYPARVDPRWSNAKCNDQTDFAFQVRLAPTPSNRWVVFFEGGGSCDGTFQGCRGRSTTLTSSTGFAPEHADEWVSDNATVFSLDPEVNPEFHAANMVWGKYCSSDGWSGTNATPQMIETRSGPAPWVFTGRNNARALTEILFRDYGLEDGDEILVTGNSAGGGGAWINVDLFAERMPRSIAERTIALLPSAAFNVEFHDPNFPFMGASTPADQIRATIEATYGFDSNPRCIALVTSLGLRPSVCAGSIYNYRSIAAPPPAGWGIRTMIAKNREDAATMNNYLIPPADSVDPDAIAARAAFLELMTHDMQEIEWVWAPDDPQRSADDDNLHGMLSDAQVWEFAPEGGLSLKRMTSRFWNDRTPVQQFWSGDVPHTADRP